VGPAGKPEKPKTKLCAFLGLLLNQTLCVFEQSLILVFLVRSPATPPIKKNRKMKRFFARLIAHTDFEKSRKKERKVENRPESKVGWITLSRHDYGNPDNSPHTQNKQYDGL